MKPPSIGGVSVAPAFFLMSAVLLLLVALIAWQRDDALAAAAAGLAWLICLVGVVRGFGFGLLSAPSVYLVVLGVFHLGLAVPWSLGWAAEPLPRWLFYSALSPALALVVVALWAFLGGVGAAALRPARSPSPARRLERRDDVAFHCGLLIAAVGCVALLWGVRLLGFERMASATYFETYRLARTYDPRFFVTGLQLAPMGLYLATAAAPRRRLMLVAAFLAAWAAGIFALGFRGFALAPVVTLVAVLDKRGVRVPRPALAAAVATMLFAIPAVRSMRSNPLNERNVADLTVAAGPLDAIQEMGGSLRPLVHTVELLENEPFRWGKTYLQAIGEITPNLNPAWKGDGYVELEDLPPSHWVSKLVAPWSYRNYGGIGFSAVAEPYMNFGVAGVALFFFLLGWGLARLDRAAERGPAGVAALAVVLGPLLWATRNTMAVFCRPAVWGLAAVAAAFLLSKSLRRLPRAAALRPSPGAFGRPC